MTLRLHIERQLLTGKMGIWLWDEQGDRVYLAKPTELIFEEHESRDHASRLPETPTLSLPHHLWAGLKHALPEALSHLPYESQVIATNAELKAARSHLEDMRQIVFKQLGMEPR